MFKYVVSDMDKYIRKALAGSVVGFLSGATGLAMQGAGLKKMLALGFGEGLLGSATTQGILNEDGEINWVVAISEGMFSSVMAGVVWRSGNTEIKGTNTKEAINNLESENNNLRKVVNTQGKRNDTPLTKEQYDELASYAINYGFPKENIAPFNADSPFETGLSFGNRLYINNDALPSNVSNGDPNS